ncbi:hypothetical protein B7463_g3383, partial [Scytalidium lignicola]
MARHNTWGPTLRPQPGSRFRPLLRGIPNVPWDQQFRTYIDDVCISQLDEDSVVFIPTLDYMEDEPEESRKMTNSQDMTRICKTTALYEEITARVTLHPRIAKFLHRDPWSTFPILAKPSGPPLVDFLAKQRSAMYSTPVDGALPRVLPQYRPLIYQWSLQLLSGLSFLHSRSIIFGDPRVETCWLALPSLDLSLIGFLDAGYLSLKSGIKYDGSSWRNEPFHPCHIPKFNSVVPTMQTDLFLWGCLIYELMTTFWPGHGQGKQSEDIQQMIIRRMWPVLENDYLGDIVRKCWEHEYEDILSLRRDVIAFITNDGWEIEGEDGLGGFRADELFETSIDGLIHGLGI